MSRLIGTSVFGLRGPIVNKGDDIATIAFNVLKDNIDHNSFLVHDRDVFAITESVVARSQGNYCSVDDIKEDLMKKFKGKVHNLGLVFPILSRNRFSMMLKGFAKATEKVTIQFSYPSDEVGNHLISPEIMDNANIDPYKNVFNEQQWVSKFGRPKHTFTDVDYVSYYRELVEAEGAKFEAIFANDPREILKHTQTVIACDIHTRFRTKDKLLKAKAEQVYLLSDIMNESINGSGYNEKYGLLGSNKATEELLKLFPHDCRNMVLKVQELVKKYTGKTIEVMVYGDGAFKDPVGKIWELADPVVSPSYTPGLEGQPNELKLKYLADHEYGNLSAEQKKEAIIKAIETKDANLKGQMKTEGTTPRALTDLLGSLCDLTSGSGDKGTPFIYIKGYFDNYATEK